MYGNGMHDFLLDELELGERAAMALDDEAIGFGPLFDVSYELYLAVHEPEAPHGPNRKLVERLLQEGIER